ncbi:BFD domain protein (2Fe-2S)-binding domain protein [Thermosinus carboxydivorans Nor1]|uniref:BFD domain protein (2Fe-2S)-binding domain protein n=1 Tax=Thermosinus carboxydivorans Nor1 TaxID=401526 RepID=A1HRL1_9FIRM|nr:(2Fe-2S)-binding protein [Thermosinus carboxydivorans]EAX47374.1 BFD domain protein (2Fe-2S)-binding domain protein [Thermosinus carboxydivorans Nor1]
MADDIIVCRCEDITLAQIRQLVAAGLTSLEEIKRACRCGMGPCQGRTCLPLIAQEISRLTGKPLADIALPTFRPPTVPLKLELLTRGEEHDQMG